MKFELRTHHDDRTTGVVNTLTQQVLTETAAFTFDHFGQRFQRTLVRTRHCFTTASVVEQRINRFLQHALFVARDDFRRAQFHQTLQTVVTIDHAAVQIVQIRGRETTAVQRDQRTQFRRQHRQHFHDHPVRLDAGTLEGFEYFQTLRVFLDFRFGFGFTQIRAQLFRFTIDVDGTQ